MPEDNDRQTVIRLADAHSVGNQLDLLAASPDPRNPWRELRIIRLLALRDQRELRATPPLELERAA